MLGVILALLVAANFAIRSRAENRGVEFLPEMIFPVAAESFGSHSGLMDSRTLQRPPAGTIARGSTPFRLPPGDEGSALAATTLVNPLQEAGDEDMTRAGEVYSVYCQLCHGPGGAGDGPVAQRGFPMPPSLLAPHARELADGQIFHLISVGQGNMPGHAGQIESLDRWRAALWVRKLQEENPGVDEAVELEPLDAAGVDE